MSTLTTIAENLADLRDTVTRERQFAAEERDGLLGTVAALREGIDALESAIRTAFAERDGTLAALIGGNGGPQPGDVIPVDRPF
jgi:hypothetical protein